jgi:hypothetical protein
MLLRIGTLLVSICGKKSTEPIFIQGWSPHDNLWELTLQVQYRALVDGAVFASMLGDTQGGQNYGAVAQKLVFKLLNTFTYHRLPHSTNFGILAQIILWRTSINPICSKM